ncbi:MAG: hypothetical protein K2J62_03780 [Bacteroidales bacterium]|nr:hypothetical protein [Bacteroidales bacterium]
MKNPVKKTANQKNFGMKSHIFAAGIWDDGPVGRVTAGQSMAVAAGNAVMEG